MRILYFPIHIEDEKGICLRAGQDPAVGVKILGQIGISLDTNMRRQFKRPYGLAKGFAINVDI